MTLWVHEETRPVALNAIIGEMNKFYSRTRREYLGDALNTEHSTVMTLYNPDGVWALEYHDERRLAVQLEEVHQEKFLNRIDSKFNRERYEKLEIDPDDVIEAAP